MTVNFFLSFEFHSIVDQKTIIKILDSINMRNACINLLYNVYNLSKNGKILRLYVPEKYLY